MKWKKKKLFRSFLVNLIKTENEIEDCVNSKLERTDEIF